MDNIFATFSNMDELEGHYAKFKKSDREGKLLYDSTYMEHLKSIRDKWI